MLPKNLAFFFYAINSWQSLNRDPTRVMKPNNPDSNPNTGGEETTKMASGAAW